MVRTDRLGTKENEKKGLQESIHQVPGIQRREAQELAVSPSEKQESL